MRDKMVVTSSPEDEPYVHSTGQVERATEGRRNDNLDLSYSHAQEDNLTEYEEPVNRPRNCIFGDKSYEHNYPVRSSADGRQQGDLDLAFAPDIPSSTTSAHSNRAFERLSSVQARKYF